MRREDFTILDVGCGGGRTLSKLATAATQGKVYGIDYSKERVAVTKRMNARWLEMGRVEVRQASVSHLPFQDGMFDLVTAVENVPFPTGSYCRDDLSSKVFVDRQPRQF